MITSGDCRKILLSTTSQKWWNVDQVDRKHAKWRDAMEHIGARLDLVVCYSSDNAGCVLVSSVQN